MNILSKTPAIAALLLLAAAPALAQGIGTGIEADHPVRVTAGVEPSAAGAGQKLTVRVTAEIDPEYHIYGLPPVPELTYPTTLRIETPPGIEAVGKVRGPEPTSHADPTLGGEEVPWFQGTAVFEQDLFVKEGAAAGAAKIVVRLDHMACTEKFCLDPAVVSATVPLEILAEAAAGGPGPKPGVQPPPKPGVQPPPKPGPSATAEPAEKEDESLGGLIVAAFIGGLLSVLLPCVYPLIPLTLAFFSKHEGSRAQAVGRAILFCAGILLTFTGLGVLVGGSLQVIAASLWLNLFLFFLMAALALSLLGMFDIALPSSWTTRMQAIGGGASFLAPIFMGVAFSLASFTCTVGVIGPLLATSATEVSRAAAGMFAYSVGFALPFFVLALFPVLISAMPRSGGWLNTVKVLLGFFEICFAGYYLWRVDLALGWGVGTWEIVLAVWTVTTFMAGFYLLGKIRLPHDQPTEGVSVPRAVGAIVYFAGALYLFGGLMNQIALPAWMEGLLPPRRLSYVAGADGTATVGRGVDLAPKPEFADDSFHPGYGGVWWTTDYEKALEIGRETGRRVFLNFTGIYCSNCRTMEKGTFNHPSVRAEFQKMVLVELWTDIPTEEAGEAHDTHTTVALSERYRDLRKAPRPEGYATTSNPHYVVRSPDGRILAESGYEADEEKFISFLRTE